MHLTIRNASVDVCCSSFLHQLPAAQVKLRQLTAFAMRSAGTNTTIVSSPEQTELEVPVGADPPAEPIQPTVLLEPTRSATAAATGEP